MLLPRYLLLFVVCLFTKASAQETTHPNKQTMDAGDLFRKIFKKDKGKVKPVKKSAIAILPTAGYNPSFGFIIGGKASGAKRFGKSENTNYSIFGLEAIYSSNGITNVQLRHNAFNNGNKLNFQGNWQMAHYGMVDYGIGTGNRQYRSEGFNINEFPFKNSDSSFPLQYSYVRFFEKGYYKIGPHLFVGLGLNFNVFSNIQDDKKINGYSTPHERYSIRHGFDPKKYSLNGFLLALQYNTRDHPVRSYHGVYADLNITFNQQWLGSTENSIQLQYDFRKYWSLSKRNPEHVIALWLWASHKLTGDIPYLALPCTASDTYGRSGRAYTFGRFKGPSYSDWEIEYRFPITGNKLISGVMFFNVQSASDDLNKKIYNSLMPGGGLGLRILFQKQTRTTLCIDVAKGDYGSSGIFFGLNEAF